MTNIFPITYLLKRRNKKEKEVGFCPFSKKSEIGNAFFDSTVLFYLKMNRDLIGNVKKISILFCNSFLYFRYFKTVLNGHLP